MALEARRGRTWLWGAAGVATLAAIGGGAMVNARGDAAAADVAQAQKAVNAAYSKLKGLREGKNADYIPVLAKVDPDLFGIALVTTEGKLVTAGDVKSEVSIQSIAKVFTMARVMEESGED